MPFGLSAGEIVVLFVVAVLVFGGRLPEVARNVGRTLAELRRGWHREVSDFERIGSDAPAPPDEADAGAEGEAAADDEKDEDKDRPPPGWEPPPDGEDCPGVG